MQLSRKWLSEFVEFTATDHEFAEDLTRTGSKVEGTLRPGDEISNVVVGKVTAMERHPDSDHLWVTMVDVGREAPLQIVTGAQNVSVGDLVPVALHNSTLTGGVKIKKGKLRGVESDGMLCSLGELGLDTHDFPYAIENGIFILQEDCKPGDDIKPIVGLDDSIVEFEITNNRPDCLSVIGLARETAATYDVPLKLHTPVVKGCGGDIRDHLSIEIEDPALCPRYTARIVKDIKVEFLSDNTAEAILTLVEITPGFSQTVIISLEFEEAIWRISNWLVKSHDVSGSLLVEMEKYIGL